MSAVIVITSASISRPNILKLKGKGKFKEQQYQKLTF